MIVKHRRRKSKKAKRGVHLSPKSTEPIHYRSSWELEFASWMDVQENIISYSYEPFSIVYVSNIKTGRTRRYFPDFKVDYVDGTTRLIEIKPKKKLTNVTNVKKFLAASLYCAERRIVFQVLTEEHLRALGLLKRKSVTRRGKRK